MTSPGSERTFNPDVSRPRNYLLRLWKDAPDAPWQAQLRSSSTDEEYYFDSLDSLITFLHEGETGTSGTEPAGNAVPLTTGQLGSQEEPAAHSGDLWLAAVGSIFVEAFAYPRLAALSLQEAITLEGGEDVAGAARLLLRAAAPAVLYTSHPDLRYPHTFEWVVEAVNEALASQDREAMLRLAQRLDRDSMVPL
jgi:hypothetical protein